MKCEHCDTEYTEDEYEALEVTSHNAIWNFDYRLCKCGREITPVELNEAAKIG